MSTATPKVQFQFKKAVKQKAKGRVALIGPAGSGKSFTGLRLARTLAGPTGKIAAVDTEHGSLSKYAGSPGVETDNLKAFDFDVIELASFTTENFIGALNAAEEAGYDVFMCDSLSHFWVGKDGALEFVELAAKRHRDNMGGWKEFSPNERAMIDAMIASKMHVIVTMRTKTEYVEEVNPSTGKKQRRKVGLAPVQRQGLEYEFDLVAYMDDENTFITDKTRCSEYAAKAFIRPGEKEFLAFRDWLAGGADRPVDTQPVNQPVQPNPRPPAKSPDTTADYQAALARLRTVRAAVPGAFSLGAAALNFKSMSDVDTLAKARKFLAWLGEDNMAPEGENVQEAEPVEEHA
jgi:hypothetical protein